MKKREQMIELSNVGCAIQQILKGNEVVIERYKNYGVSLTDLIDEYTTLQTAYNKRWSYLTKGKSEWRTLIDTAKADMEKRVDNMSNEEVLQLAELVGIS